MRILGTVASSSREVPGAPTIGTATNVGSGRAYNNGRADVTFTAPAFDGGYPVTSYTVTSSPGGFTGTGASSPVTVTGLQSSTSYTFTVTATSAIGTGPASAASNSITATTVPQAPTIGTATGGNASATVTYTAGATGGAAVSAYTATSTPGSITGTGTSPITVSGLTNGTAYTFRVTATNANGTSATSAASNSVTPVIPLPVLSAFTAVSYPNSYYWFYPGGIYLNNQAGFWGGANQATGATTTADVYTWTGSSFTTAASSINGSVLGLGSDGTTVQVMGARYGAGQYDNGSQYTTSLTGGFTNATVMPISIGLNAGIGWLGTNTFSSVGGFGASLNRDTNYYRTGAGAWSTGTVAPIVANSWKGTYANGRGYILRNTDIYYETSAGGAWTLESTSSSFQNQTPACVVGINDYIWGWDASNTAFCYYYKNGTSTYAGRVYPLNSNGQTATKFNNTQLWGAGANSQANAGSAYYATIS